MIEQRITAKELDAFVSFLGRLNNAGSSYIKKNDIIMATVKGNRSGTRGKIPGRHLIRDPLFIDDEDAFIEGAVYCMPWTIEQLLTIFKQIKETRKDLRKEIYLIRDREGVYIDFCHEYGYKYQVFGLVNRNYLDDKDYERYAECGSNISWFDDFIDTIDNIYYWTELTKDELISLRNDSIMILKQTVNDKNMFARIARSVFIMSGVTRKDTPLAERTRYALMPPSNTVNKDVGMLRIHTFHKAPGGSKIFKVECIHDYMILVYDEGEETDKNE